MVELEINLPDNFLDEEVRCGYVVSKEMKEVWAVELDLFVKFEKVCRKYDLKYTASGGTMLGVVRHNGFIPWDDDIDIDMPRKDYEKLCFFAPREFHYPYFFQTEYSDKGSLRGHAQFRRSDTTAILEREYGVKKFNQGIFIDIFPLDNIPDDPIELKKYSENILRFKKYYSQISSLSNIHLLRKTKHKNIVNTLYFIPFMVLHFFNIEGLFYKIMEIYAQKYNNNKTMRVAPSCFIPDKERHRYPSKYLEEMIEAPFEFLTIKVSKEYHIILTQMYGDYMTFQVGESLHGRVIFDASQSYLDYIKCIDNELVCRPE